MSGASYAAQAYRWAVREGRKIGPNAESVLVVLVSYADLKTGECFPHRDTIAKVLYDTDNPTKSQLNMISEAITDLFEEELIEDVQQEVNRGRRGGNHYVLNLPENIRDAVPSGSGHGDDYRTQSDWAREPNESGHGEPNRSGHGSPVGLGAYKSPSQVSKEKVSTRSTSASDSDSRGKSEDVDYAALAREIEALVPGADVSKYDVEARGYSKLLADWQERAMLWNNHPDRDEWPNLKAFVSWLENPRRLRAV